MDLEDIFVLDKETKFFLRTGVGLHGKPTMPLRERAVGFSISSGKRKKS